MPNGFLTDFGLGLAITSGWLLQVQLPTEPLGAVGGLIGQGAIVAGFLVWLTQSLVPRLQAQHREDRAELVKLLEAERAAHSDALERLRESHERREDKLVVALDRIATSLKEIAAANKDLADATKELHEAIEVLEHREEHH